MPTYVARDEVRTCPGCDALYRVRLYGAVPHASSTECCPACSRASMLGQAVAFHPGWSTLITEIVAALVALDPDLRWGMNNGPYEKFGTLRVQFDSSPWVSSRNVERMSQIMAAARARSATICEVCGAPGRLVGRSYQARTRCAAHPRDVELREPGETA